MLDVRFQPMTDRVKDPLARTKYLNDEFECPRKMDALEAELRRLGATDIVIESGHDRLSIRNDGWPKSGSRPAHPDVRLYFATEKHGTLRYECNAFGSFESNLYAIALWLQRQRRAIDDWGIGGAGEVYRGFMALPAPGGTTPGTGNGQPVTRARPEWSGREEAVSFLRGLCGMKMSTPALELAVVKETLINGALRKELFRQAARASHPDAASGEGTETAAKVNRAKDFIEGAHP